MRVHSRPPKAIENYERSFRKVKEASDDPMRTMVDVVSAAHAAGGIGRTAGSRCTDRSTRGRADAQDERLFVAPEGVPLSRQLERRSGLHRGAEGATSRRPGRGGEAAQQASHRPGRSTNGRDVAL